MMWLDFVNQLNVLKADAEVSQKEGILNSLLSFQSVCVSCEFWI